MSPLFSIYRADKSIIYPPTSGISSLRSTGGGMYRDGGSGGSGRDDDGSNGDGIGGGDECAGEAVHLARRSLVEGGDSEIGKRIENGAKTGFIGLNLVKSNYYSNYDEVVKCPRAYQWKECKKTSSTVTSDFIGPARNPFNGSDQPK
ncbi:hypothetical protein Tco_1533079 [Tanacetum coccineum]